MKLLSIETSSTICSVALLNNTEITTIHEVAPMQQAQKILPMINNLLTQSSVSLNQLDALVFGCGPGSFTGIRIATSVAQGMGFALDLPLIPISSLAGLAQAAYQDLGWKKLLVAVDARIQEVYWGAYQVNSEDCVELIDKELVTHPENLPSVLGENWSGVGDAWKIYNTQMPIKPFQIDSSRLPMAKGLLPIAKLKYEKKEWVRPENALPTYLRDEVATKQK